MGILEGGQDRICFIFSSYSLKLQNVNKLFKLQILIAPSRFILYSKLLLLVIFNKKYIKDSTTEYNKLCVHFSDNI
jgi:hypothetical protein